MKYPLMRGRGCPRSQSPLPACALLVISISVTFMSLKQAAWRPLVPAVSSSSPFAELRSCTGRALPRPCAQHPVEQHRPFEWGRSGLRTGAGQGGSDAPRRLGDASQMPPTELTPCSGAALRKSQEEVKREFDFEKKLSGSLCGAWHVTEDRKNFKTNFSPHSIVQKHRLNFGSVCPASVRPLTGPSEAQVPSCPERNSSLGSEVEA